MNSGSGNPVVTLADLRDIHLPSELIGFIPSFWLIGIIIAVIIGFLVIRHIRLRSLKLKALNEIDQILKNARSDKELAEEISEILKRLAITIFGHKKVASLHGKKWGEWLAKTAHNTDFTNKIGQFMVNAPYMREEKRRYDKKLAEKLGFAAKDWIRRNVK